MATSTLTAVAPVTAAFGPPGSAGRARRSATSRSVASLVGPDLGMTVTRAAVPSELGVGGVTTATSSRAEMAGPAFVAASTAPVPSNSMTIGPLNPAPKPSVSIWSARAWVLSEAGRCTRVVRIEANGMAITPSATTARPRARTRLRVTAVLQPARNPRLPVSTASCATGAAPRCLRGSTLSPR